MEKANCGLICSHDKLLEGGEAAANDDAANMRAAQERQAAMNAQFNRRSMEDIQDEGYNALYYTTCCAWVVSICFLIIAVLICEYARTRAVCGIEVVFWCEIFFVI